jgi:hypothetical protein
VRCCQLVTTCTPQLLPSTQMVMESLRHSRRLVVLPALALAFTLHPGALLQVRLPLGRREARFSMLEGDFKVGGGRGDSSSNGRESSSGRSSRVTSSKQQRPRPFACM